MSADSPFRLSKAGWIWLIVLLIAGAVPRVWDLGGKSLWLDEARAIRVSKDIDRIVPMNARGHSPPLRDFLTHYLQKFEPMEFHVRLPSAIGSIASIALMFFWVHAWLGLSVAVVSTALMVASPWQIYHAQDARMYALFQTLVLGSLLAAETARRSGRLRWFAVLGVLMAAQAYVTSFGLITSFMITLFLALTAFNGLRRSRDERWKSVRPMAIGLTLALAVAGAIYGPWLLVLPGQLAQYEITAVEETKVESAPGAPATSEAPRSGVAALVTRYDWKYVMALLTSFAAKPAWAAIGVFALVVVGVAVAAARRRLFLLLAVIWFGVPAGILIATTVGWFFPPRYLFFWHPMILALAALGLTGAASLIRRTAIRQIVIAVAMASILGAMAVDARAYFAEEKQDWRGAAEFLEREMDYGDMLTTGLNWTDSALRVYLDPRVKAVEFVGTVSDLGKLRSLLSEGTNVWFVSWTPLPQPYVEAIRPNADLVKTFSGTQGAIKIWRGKREPPPLGDS